MFDIETEELVKEIYSYYKPGRSAKSFGEDSDLINLYAYLKNKGYVDSFEYIFAGREFDIYKRLITYDMRFFIDYRSNYFEKMFTHKAGVANLSNEEVNQALIICWL